MKSGRLIAWMAGAAMLGCVGADTIATAASEPATAQVSNFMLVDQNLEAHELYRLADSPAIVLVTQLNGDAATRALAPQINKIAAEYGARRIEFMMINSSANNSWDAIRAEAAKVGYSVPILMDDKQIIGESLGVTRSAEAIVIDPKTWTIAYRGALNGLPAALDAMLAGKPAPTANAPGAGAPIAFPARQAGAGLTYVKDVAPILEKKCVACHEQGGIGPMQLTSYPAVKGFAPMIREVIRTDRMPPFHADPHVGQFSDSKRLSPDEIKTIVHWVEAGAPRGDGPDPLATKPHLAAEWPLGTPDLVLNIPAYDVPASGVVDYQRPVVANPATKGEWIRATTVVPGSRQAVHHVLSGWMPQIPKDGKSHETEWQGNTGGYAVGSESDVYANDVAYYLPPGGAVGFQMHYTPFGKETVDNTKLGIYFRKTPPKYIMRDDVIIDTAIDIPANDGHHRELAYLEFPKAALLYQAFPHAHYRAYSSDLWIQYPDGKMKLLLSLPRYDFNWQRNYNFAKPVVIPAGSRLIAHYVYDNSKRNPSNPDPNVEVKWGEQSFQEMLYTSVNFRWLDETATRPIDSAARFEPTRVLGMLDKNLDGKIEKSELRGQIGALLAQNWDKVDTNHDGMLDREEMARASKMFGRHPNPAAEFNPGTSTPTSD